MSEEKSSMQNFTPVSENGILFVPATNFDADIKYVTTKGAPWANLDVLAFNCFGDCYGINCKGQNALTLSRIFNQYKTESVFENGFLIRWARVHDEEDPQFLLDEPSRWETENISNYKGTFRLSQKLTFKKVHESFFPKMKTWWTSTYYLDDPAILVDSPETWPHKKIGDTSSSAVKTCKDNDEDDDDISSLRTSVTPSPKKIKIESTL